MLKIERGSELATAVPGRNELTGIVVPVDGLDAHSLAMPDAAWRTGLGRSAAQIEALAFWCGSERRPET